MSNGVSSDATDKVPVLLLKTKSIPVDTYEEHLAGRGGYAPIFIPVLEHRFKADSLQWLDLIVQGAGFTRSSEPDTGHSPLKDLPRQYGGIIFTSQRAVEAFTGAVKALDDDAKTHRLPACVPLYVVGPATGRGLKALDLECPIVGGETGNGEALAAFILHHYNSLDPIPKSADGVKLPLLFLVGEQRRDIIPKTLQSPDLPQEQRIGVVEVPVYETGEMQSFHSDFDKALAANTKRCVPKQWVVVFSPTGCKAMLRCLGWLNEATGRYDAALAAAHFRNTFVATIGPTTRNYLVEEFGFEAQVCAEKPSPEGVRLGIETFEINKLRS